MPLTGIREIFFKEVGVLRAKKADVKELSAIPDDALEALARCLYPAIVAYFESDEGKREFAEWQTCNGIENLSGGESKPEIRFAG